MRDGGRESSRSNRLGVIKFPGVDLKRDIQLHEFLVKPIDSRDLFDVPEERKATYRQMIRASEPSPEIKNRWDQRMQKLRAESRMMMRRQNLAVVPQVMTRQSTNTEHLMNPYNCTVVEAVANHRNHRARMD
jgi:hypothetical protein